LPLGRQAVVPIARLDGSFGSESQVFILARHASGQNLGLEAETESSRNFFTKIRIRAISLSTRADKTGVLRKARRQGKGGDGNFFYFFRCNPLKSHVPDE
jgi:hypothetical protein